MIVRRCFLTLIEIMIVVSILLIVTGAIGFNIRRALITQRFNTETALFVDTIRLAQDMMLILSKDVQLKVRSGTRGSGIEYSIEVEGGVPKGWESLMKRSHRLMESVHYIGFEKQDPFPSQPGQLDLRFQSKGSMMSKGELQFSSREDPLSAAAMRRAVCLKGYPHTIKSEIVTRVPARDEMWTSCDDEEENESFFEQLTTYTIEDLEKDAPPQEAGNSEDKDNGQQTDGDNDQVQ